MDGTEGGEVETVMSGATLFSGSGGRGGKRDEHWKQTDESEGFKRDAFVLPADEAEKPLQASRVDVALAELQLSPRVVVNVVHTHFIHDAKTSLSNQRDRRRQRYND